VTDEQFTVSLRAFARRRPFRHFLLEFTNGREIQIRHPEGIAPFAGVWLFQEPSGDRAVFASTAVCRLRDVPQAQS
jgi:hypothetical protein